MEIVVISVFLLGGFMLACQLYMIYLMQVAEPPIRVYLFPELDLELTEYPEEQPENKYVSCFWSILDRILHP